MISTRNKNVFDIIYCLHDLLVIDGKEIVQGFKKFDQVMNLDAFFVAEVDRNYFDLG